MIRRFLLGILVMLIALLLGEFVTRFRVGRVLPGSPMPWQGLQRMNEEDLRAMYRYLKSVPPVSRDNRPPMGDAKPQSPTPSLSEPR